MTITQDPREQRGQEIANMQGQIRALNQTTYLVKSQSGNGRYQVKQYPKGWTCECSDYVYRHVVKCKHIYAVELSIKLKAHIQTVRTIQPIENLNECIYCKSPNIEKDGVRKNKSGNIQMFHCKNCGRYFTFNIGFERMKHNPQAITSAMQLYFSGESLRNTMKSLKLLGVEVSHQTVYNWINKYVKLMKNYVETFKPNVSDTWRADELYVKVKGDMKYLFALMDDETRYWIAQEVAETKYKHDARNLFQMAKNLTDKKPTTLITDGLQAYNDAYRMEFWTQEKPRTEHIRDIHFRNRHNNNKMERLNGEIRDREKTMRGLKTKDTPILSGYQIFHNYIRTHEALRGRTPSEACGITIKGKDKWMTLIQNAGKNSV